MPVRCLSIHAGYACRHRGACCTSGWPIPVEVGQLARLRTSLASGALRPVAPPAAALFDWPPGAPPDAPALLATDAGRCVFFDPRARRCRIHTALGHGALPLACRQFPRVVVRDPRGVSVTLSHYCPTAAALLGDARPVQIVTSPAAYPDDGEYEGLDARDSLPPLLRPNLLMDWESWWVFEQLSVDTLVTGGDPPDRALARLAATIEALRSWTPGDGPLHTAVRRAFERAPLAGTRAIPDLAARRREVAAAIPADLQATFESDVRNASPEAGDAPSPAILVRFVAAHAFANWTAHLGSGLRTWLRSVEAAYACATDGAGVRHADLLLRHLADPRVLAATWSAVER